MLWVKVGGRRLSIVGPYGPVTVQYGIHGSESASWQMRADTRHPILRGNALVEIYDGGTCVWIGTLVEPSSGGSYAARGLWRQAEAAPALDGTGSNTAIPDVAITAARNRDDISFGYDLSVGATAVGDGTGEATLAELLNANAAIAGKNWVVGTDYTVRLVSAVPSGTPQWVVPHAVRGRGLSPSDGEFHTHLAGRYQDSVTGANQTAYAGNLAAEDYFGRRTGRVDLTHLGGMTGTRAAEILVGMLERTGARMGFGEALELAYGQITNGGGTSAPLAQIMNGQTIRLAGVIDTSKASLVSGSTHIISEAVTYTSGAKTISITPAGYAPQTLGDALTSVLAGN